MTKKKPAAKRKTPAHHVDKSVDTVGGQTQSNEVTGNTTDPAALNYTGPVPTEAPPIPGVPVSEGLDPHTPPNAN